MLALFVHAPSPKPLFHRRSRRDAMPRLPQRSKRLLRLPRIQNPSPTGAGAATDAMPQLPPALPSELVEEILLRVPPEEPRSLFRPTLVCKLWLRILTGAAFRKAYRERHHGTPPMLGIFHNDRKTFYHTQFVPTLADLSPPRLRSSPFLRALDARHGRVLFKMDADPAEDVPRKPAPHEHFLVWDPITHEGWVIPMPGRSIGGWFALLCAKDGCDHLDCHGHPFRVAHAFVDEFDFNSFSAYLYSSVNGTWSDRSSVEFDGEDKDLNHFCNLYEITTNVLAGNALYFDCDLSPVIMRYGLADRELSLIEKPDVCRYMSGHVTVENGVLGFAALLGFSIYIWSREVDEHGAAAWVQPRVIKLETLLPPRHLHD